MCVGAALAGSVSAGEANVWPFWVGEEGAESGAFDRWSALGPFFFETRLPAPEAPAQTARGFRPLYVEKTDSTQDKVDEYILYPLFSYHTTRYGYRRSLFSLINHYSAHPPSGGDASAGAAQPGGFDLWPVYFSRETGDPATSYHAVMPFYGTIQKRFGLDTLSWTLFPLYARAEKRHVTTTAVLWPFFRTIKGEGNHGFTFWPLFGHREKEGAYRESFYLWPLIYRDEHALWQKQPVRSFGVLPFYAAEESPAATSETILWPFFGYTDRTQPVPYHERRYFWPFFVQGRGDNIEINRWGPFYTHSLRKGVDKTWVLWPFWRHQTWTDSGLDQTRNQFLWFVYHSTEQRSARNPALPSAYKKHLWPLVSVWDNGAGKKQVQVLSLFAPLFPSNEPIQLAYDPLFALYRYDRKSPDDCRHVWLWNFISWRRTGPEREFHLGPLLGFEGKADSARLSFGCGAFGLKRETTGSWHAFLFEFKRRPSKPASPQP